MRTRLIKLSYWKPDPDRPGYLKFVGTPTYRQVFDLLHEVLEAEGLIDEYFEPSLSLEQDTSLTEGRQRLDEPVPRDIRWVCCWTVRGGSEGDYIHIEFDVTDRWTGKAHRVPFALGKTFLGRDHAWRIARRVAELLDVC